MQTKFNFCKAEHLLWIVPVVYGFIAFLTAPSGIVFAFFRERFVAVSFPGAVIYFLLSMLIPFICHWLLRELGLRSTVISWIHILPSISMVATILFIYSYIPIIHISWKFRLSPIPQYTIWQYYNNIAVLLSLLFISAQVIFVGYSVIRIVPHMMHQAKAAKEEYYNADEQEHDNHYLEKMIA